MAHARTARTTKTTAPAALGGALLAALGAPVQAQTPAPGFTLSTFATGAAVNATRPDSITVSGSNVFVGYANGTSSVGSPTNGNSTIVEYTFSGGVVNTFSLQGGNDGLQVDPSTGLVWALQNQDGNPVLDVINATSNTINPYAFLPTSGSRGYDDIVFKGTTAYLSFTNPAAGTDPIILSTSTTLPAPGGTLTLTPVVTSTSGGGTITDPDSLTLTPTGNLLLDGEGDQALLSVTNPGTGSQATSLIPLKDPTGKGVVVDDTRFAGTGPQRLLIADTSKNTIWALTGAFTAGSPYTAASGSDFVGALSLSTGALTPVVTGLGSPHGMQFAPAAVPEPGALALLGLGLLPLAVVARRRAARS